MFDKITRRLPLPVISSEMVRLARLPPHVGHEALLAREDGPTDVAGQPSFKLKITVLSQLIASKSG